MNRRINGRAARRRAAQFTERYSARLWPPAPTGSSQAHTPPPSYYPSGGINEPIALYEGSVDVTLDDGGTATLDGAVRLAWLPTP